MFAGIQKLAPAERMTVAADGAIRSEIYWSPCPGAARERRTRRRGELGERLLELLRASISKRMMSDVPFGVFLSGGVDSSTNVALMSELMSEPVRTFSVGFHDHERYNELEYARAIARQFKTDHHEVLIDVDDLVSSCRRWCIIRTSRSPTGCVSRSITCRNSLATSGTIVVQVGEGSDELFHGYRHYIDAVARRRRYWGPFQRVPRPVRRAARGVGDELARARARETLHAQYVADAADGRLPFWGGAICYTRRAKESDPRGNGCTSPDAYRVVRRLWEEAERAARAPTCCRR